MPAGELCDKCGSARAVVLIAFAAGTLAFCKHDYEANANALPANARVLVDQRSLLA